MSTAPSPILLRLDARALAALFPEGTQARADLQQAVIAEFVRKHIKPSNIGHELNSKIREATKDAIDKALAEIGVKKGRWGEIGITPELGREISQAARNAVDDQARKAAKEAAERMSADVQGWIKRITDKEISEAVKARVATVMEQISKGAL